MHCNEQILADFCDPEKLLLCLRIQSLPILWLVLRGLVVLSQRREMARRVRVLLPDIMDTRHYANGHITMKALMIFKNVMGHLENREASRIAPNLAEMLLPLFNDASSEVRECSMRLFKGTMEAVVWWKKADMRKKVRRALMPLFFWMSDETQSVAKASGEVLLACAKFLKWKQLKDLAQTGQMWSIRECLVQRSRSEVEGYLQQSLPYLEDAQANVRLEAVRFIGLAAWHSKDQGEEKLQEIIC
ncbi:MROH7 protein, partial [Anseranas semipalmata]|nr:MROH7 protein [Anseranas semipalmata]